MKLIDLRGEVSCYNMKWWRRRWINNTNKHSVAYPLFSIELKKLSHTDINYRKQDNHYSQRIQEQMIFASATFSTIRMLLIIKETTLFSAFDLCDIYDRLLICIDFVPVSFWSMKFWSIYWILNDLQGVLSILCTFCADIII